MDRAIDLNTLPEIQLRQLAAQLLERVNDQAVELNKRDQLVQSYKIRNEQLTHELAILKRHRFGRRSEQGGGGQLVLLDEIVDEDIAAIETELERFAAEHAAPRAKVQQPRRQRLPAELPRTEIRHDPESTTCACGCQMVRVGEEVSEKLDYEPGQFSVERHIRSKWACRACETLTQVPVAPHIIDKGLPTTNLLAHVLISKYADHLPLYRQQQIFKRSGVELPRSTLADWVGRCGVELSPLVEALREQLLSQPVLHADETPIRMLEPGKKQSHRAYVWAYASTQWSAVQGVVYDFQPTRSGEASRAFLQSWRGSLICDDYTGYKAGFAGDMTEVGCWAHVRRKFFELTERNQSPLGEQALRYIGALYEIERQARELTTEQRHTLRQAHAGPVIETLHDWLLAQRERLTNGTRTARAIDYALKRWAALLRYLDDGQLPIDNNWVENQIRPWALGRNNWLFAGSLRSGQRAANVMTLIQSAKINGLDPQAYLRDILQRMPTARHSDLSAMLPHNWQQPLKV